MKEFKRPPTADEQRPTWIITVSPVESPEAVAREVAYGLADGFTAMPGMSAWCGDYEPSLTFVSQTDNVSELSARIAMALPWCVLAHVERRTTTATEVRFVDLNQYRGGK